MVKGQTASSSYKPAVLDNGVRVMVPPHIGSGTRIVVDVYSRNTSAARTEPMVSHSGLITVMTARRAQGGAAPAPRLRRGRASPGQPQGPGRLRVDGRQARRADARRGTAQRAARLGLGARGRRRDRGQSGQAALDRRSARWHHQLPPRRRRISPSRSRSRSRKPGGGSEITQALVYQPLTDESFWAEKGRGAWLKERRLRVSARRDLSEALIGTGIPHCGRGDFGALGEDLRRGRRRRSSGVRRFGSAALDLAWVAAGRMDGFWEDDLDIWDTAAGVLLVRKRAASSPIIAAATGSFERREYVAGNGDIHSQAAQAGRGSASVIGAAGAGRGAAAAQPQTVLTIDPRHRLVEGVASDGKTIWVSSILDRQVLACRKTCRTLATLPAPAASVRDRLGSRARAAVGRGRLPARRSGDQGLRARRADRARSARADRDPHRARRSANFHPGDVSASEGGVFVSDSQNGAGLPAAAETGAA